MNIRKLLSTKSIATLAIAAIILFFTSELSAQYYWVGGTGNWSDYSNHWATSSGGSTFHTDVPTADDNVYFDSNSFSSDGGVVTLDTDDSYCKTIDWTDVTNFPSFYAEGLNTLNCYGSFILESDMSCNLTYIDMFSDDLGNDLSPSGNSLGASCRVKFLGDGSYNLTGNISCTQMYSYSGTYNSNGYTMDLTFGFWISGPDAKTVNIENSTLNLSQWRINGTNVTLQSNNSTINTQSFYGDGGGEGPYDYHNINFIENGYLYNNVNANIVDISNCAGGNFEMEDGTTLNCEDFIGIGTKLLPIELRTMTTGEEATINVSSGSVDLEYAIMIDIHGMGGASFNADQSIDYGNNVGWNIDEITPETYYWVGNGGTWHDVSHWATTSGGSTFYADMPSQFDHVIFDENSFSNTGQSISVDTTARAFSLNTLDVTNTPSFYSPYEFPLNIYGDVLMGDDFDSFMYGLRLKGNYGVYEFHTSDLTGIQNLSFLGTGTYDITGHVNSANFSVNEGTVNTNGYDIWVTYTLSISSYDDQQLNLGTSEVNTNNFQYYGSNVSAVDADEATITVRGNFTGLGNTYHHLKLDEVAIILDDNTFDILEFLPGVNATLNAGSISTINDELIVAGTSTDQINISSSEDGQQATLSLSSGIVNGSFLIIKDNVATGGATFNADQSIDNGNNVGWNITEVVPNDFYWVGGTGDWSDFENHWASTSGGSSFYAYVPGPLDNVYFDENSFSTDGQTVTVDLEQVNFHDMDWSDVDQTVSLEGGDVILNVYGSFILSDMMNIQVYNYNFLSEESEVIDPGYIGSPGLNTYMTFDSNGTWDLLDTLTTRELHFGGGTFNSNDNGIHVDFTFSFETSNTKTLNLGNSNVYSRSVSSYGDNMTLNAGNTEWYVSSQFSMTCPSCDIEMNNVTWVASADQGSHYATNIELNVLTIEPGKTVKFGSSTTTVVEQLIVEGTEEDHIIMEAISTGLAATISQSSGNVNGNYLELKDMVGSGGATFYANNSVDNGNVTGWIFSGLSQSIDFPVLSDVLEDIGTFDLVATSTSGLDVVYAITGGPATIDGDQITITGPGLVEIEASQPGDLEYNPAPSVTQTFCAIPLQPTVTGTMVGDLMELESSSVIGNQWIYNTIEITGATEQTYTATVDGNYSVIVNVNGCISEESEEFVVVGVGLEEFSETIISLYPNPANEFIVIEGNTIFDYYKIYSSNGILVEESPLNTAELHRLVTNNLQPGFYIISLMSESGTQNLNFIIE